MGVILSYSLFSSIILSLLYLTYKWVMAGENQHGFNRGILWTIYGVALASPFAAGHLPDFSSMASVAPVEMAQVEVGEIEEMWEVVGPVTVTGQPLWLTALLWIYVAGVAVALVHTVIVGLKLRSIISEGERVGEKDGKVIVVTDNAGVAPFSWCRYVVMNRRDYDEDGEMILIHEMRHLHLCHWIDLLVAQAVGIFQWYNPAAWLMREELKTVHEYQADSAVLCSGVCARDYQMLLIKKAVGARFPSLANSLNHSKLKKRITMMFNQKTSLVRRMRGLALVPALVAALAVADIDAVASVITATSSASLAEVGKETEAILPVEAADKVSENLLSAQEVGEGVTVVGYAPVAPANDGVTVARYGADTDKAEAEPVKIIGYGTEKKEESEKKAPTAEEFENKVFTVVDRKPEYPGGEAALLKYIAEHLRYPEAAFKAGAQGRVVVQFVIKKDGAVGEVRLLRSVDKELDAEAERVIKSLPAFTPGSIDGHPVAVWYTLPVTFRLKNDNPEEKKAAPTVAALPDDGVYTVVEKKPQFPGGEKALMNYICENLHYPEAAFKAGTEGRVVVQFVVKSDGAVGEVKVIRSVDKELDLEAVRVIKSLPSFTPGTIGDKPVAVWYTLPVAFRITDTKSTEQETAKETAVVIKSFNVENKLVVKPLDLKKESATLEVYIDGTKVDSDVLSGINPKMIASIEVLKGTPLNPDRINVYTKH